MKMLRRYYHGVRYVNKFGTPGLMRRIRVLVRSVLRSVVWEECVILVWCGVERAMK